MYCTIFGITILLFFNVSKSFYIYKTLKTYGNVKDIGKDNIIYKVYQTSSNAEEFIPSDDVLKVWEKEEIELQKYETIDKINKLRDEEDEVPEYMLKMLNQFNDILSPDEQVGIPQGKLPIIAVIGRPNTGKSTIVNKLTNSFKVCTS